MTQNYQYYTISKLSKLVKEQKVTSTELVAACLEQITKCQPSLNAFITVLHDEALAAAKRADEEIAAGKWRGPLHGIPVGIKDFYDTADVKTTAAFEHFAERIPSKDAVAVAKLKAAGAIIIGKTNMHKLGMGTTALDSAFGPVHNPWGLDYIAGGSSGGSAAAVAAGLCYATIDTDAVGSCRLPAACCGVVGYKCTWGLLDNTGILADQPADPAILKLATVGITTRSIEDTLLVSAALGRKGTEPVPPKSKQRIGIVTNFSADEATRTAFMVAAEVFQKLGYETSEVEAPISANPDMQHIEDQRQAAAETFKNADVMILPTLTTTVPKAADLPPDPQALSPQNTFFVNYLGLPAISVPCGFSKSGLPFGLQIVGKPNEDAMVCAVGLAYQQATDWSAKHPA